MRLMTEPQMTGAYGLKTDPCSERGRISGGVDDIIKCCNADGV